MKAEERKELEQNTLATGAQELVSQVKTGDFLSPKTYRWFGIGLAVGLLATLFWFLSSQNKAANSSQWREISNPDTVSWEEAAKVYKDSMPGRVARLEIAREQLGPKGIGKLNASSREDQNKAVTSIETAREEFLKLAGEFKNDKALQVTCHTLAADAELALVGIPKDANSPDHRGQVKTAVELYTKAAKIIGEKTPAGEELTKKAADLTARNAEITKAALDIYNRSAIAPALTFTPGSGDIKAPITLEPNRNLPTPEAIKPAVGPVGTPPTTPSPVTPITPTPVTPSSKK
ncbi:MAG: hypothetical protein ACRC8S_15645 [Fimbriiglobus sp.]